MKRESDKETLSRRLCEIFGVYRQTPRVIKLVWDSSPVLTIILPVTTIITGPLPVVRLYCWKKVIDGVALCLQRDMTSGQHMILVFLSLNVGLSFLLTGLSSLNRFLERILTLRLTRHVQSLIIGRANVLDMAFFETPAFYDKLERAQQESGYRPYTILSAFITGGRQLITFCSYLVTLFTLSSWIGPCLLLVTAPGLLLQIKFGRLAWTIGRKRTPEERRMRYYERLMTSRYEVKEMRLFQLTPYLTQRWLEIFQQIYRQTFRLRAKQNLAEFGSLVLQTIATTGFYIFAIWRTVSDSHITIGSLLMYTQAMESSIGSMTAIFHAVGSLYENNLYLSNLFEFLAQSPRIRAPAKPVPVPHRIRDAIRFESVSFRYPDSNRWVLKNICLEIRANERVALVGENGSGKTTLIKLLARLYDPQEGRITIDRTDLRQFDPAEWQRQIGVIFQDFTRFCVTARENVGFGRLEYLNNMLRIRAAAEASGATAFIEDFKDGWNTLLGRLFEDGQELSVGEWQNVALARAFLRDSQILILDEPTASLDAKREYEIFKRFSQCTQDKTTVLISHRFSTVKMADRILVIEDGCLVESGTHQELISLGNKYAELFNRQASAYR
ncbi:MAG: ABC transporter ATP-binding protein [Planctomycetota bacterium]